MKEYKNIEKYFKLTPRKRNNAIMLIKFILMMNFLGGIISALITLLVAPLKFAAIGPLFGSMFALIPLIIVRVYEQNIMNSTLAKALLYNADRGIVLGHLEQMEAELEHPLYLDAEVKPKDHNFAITGTWIIGDSSPVAEGLDAVKVSDVSEADREDLLVQKGIKNVTMYAIRVTDSKKEQHVFVFRNESKREDALYQIRVLVHI